MGDWYHIPNPLMLSLSKHPRHPRLYSAASLTSSTSLAWRVHISA